MRLPTRSSLEGFAAPALGFVVGLVLVFTYSHRAAPLRLVWAPLGVALSTTAGAVFTYGRRRWTELRELCARNPVRVSDLARVFRTADLRLIHAADCCSMYSSWTCCGVRY